MNNDNKNAAKSIKKQAESTEIKIIKINQAKFFLAFAPPQM